jgi:predicted transcriptional regulator
MAEPLKQQVLDAISQLPDDVDDMDEIMYRLYVLDKVRKGREDVRIGRVVGGEDIEREIDQW